MLAWTVNPWFLWIMTGLCFATFELTGIVLIVAAAICLFWPREKIGPKLKSAAFLLYLYALTIPLAWFGVAVGWFVISHKVSEWRYEADLNRVQPENM